MSASAHGAASQAQARMLPDGRRLHLHHGPIDLIIEAWGKASEVEAAYRQAKRAFRDVLATLVEELPLLRAPSDRLAGPLNGPVARRMLNAVRPHQKTFVTPMAAVAGAVADDILHAMVSNRCLSRAYVNNGGDIALYMSPGSDFRIAIGTGSHSGDSAGTVTLEADDQIAGVATSGWRGRSFSLGIADEVTVLASTAAAADAAATLIANAVDVIGSPAIERAPACDVYPESDLGSRLVTRKVGRLTATEISEALDHGATVAEDMRQAGLIVAALLCLQGEVVTVGALLDRKRLRLTNDCFPGQAMLETTVKASSETTNCADGARRAS